MHEFEKTVAVEEAGLSRKRFLASAAGIVVGGGALAMLPGTAKAHTPGADQEDILNYALTLEHLEYEFYRRVLAGFTEKNFRNSPAFPKSFGPYLKNRARSYFTVIRNHELEHVELLEGILGNIAVEQAQYNFRVTNMKGVIETAALLENTGVTAYNGAIAHIDAATSLTLGATIATVEARHASYLNLLNVDVPFPDALDDAVAPQDVCQTVLDNFITGAPEPYVVNANGSTKHQTIQDFCDALPDTTS